MRLMDRRKLTILGRNSPYGGVASQAFVSIIAPMPINRVFRLVTYRHDGVTEVRPAAGPVVHHTLPVLDVAGLPVANRLGRRDSLHIHDPPAISRWRISVSIWKINEFFRPGHLACCLLICLPAEKCRKVASLWLKRSSVIWLSVLYPLRQWLRR